MTSLPCPIGLMGQHQNKEIAMPIEKNYVVFYSPGTFFDEATSKPIEEFGDLSAAAELAKTIEERYASKPYGFRFVTSLEAESIPDGRGGVMEVRSKKIRESGTYFINGRLRKYDEVVLDNDPKEDILRSNMRCNSMIIIVETDNSWKHRAAFTEEDFVVNDLGAIVARGNDPELVEYRKATAARIAAEK